MPIQFVSLGPGEAELITLKGLKALQNADCIFCPETPVRDGHSLSRAADIMLRLDIPANRIRRFSLPMSKQRTDALNAYAPEMIPVHSHDGMFWGIYYLQAGYGMKFNNEKSWSAGENFGVENEDPKGYGEYPAGGSNLKVALLFLSR